MDDTETTASQQATDTDTTESTTATGTKRRNTLRYASGERLDAYTIRQVNGGGSIWVRVGSAFLNRDGSLNVYLDVLPLDGRIHLRRLSPVQQPKPTKNAA
jgi:hypothetical protein